MKLVCVMRLVGILLLCFWNGGRPAPFASDRPPAEGLRASPSADVQIIIHGPKLSVSGQDMTYTITVVNNALHTLQDFVLRAQIPSDLWYQGRDGGTPLKWSFGKMDPGAQRSVSFTVFPTRPGTYTLPAQAYVANQQGQETTFSTKVDAAPRGTTDLRLLFSIQADYRTGRIFPDAIFVDGKPIKEGETIKNGSHQFEVNARGYKRWAQPISVADEGGDGVFRLSGVMEAKERVVLFNIIDKTSSKLILPDQVTIEPTGSPGKSRTIKDRDSVKPGSYRMVIEKKGYKSLSHGISILADEAPFQLTGEMSPG